MTLGKEVLIVFIGRSVKEGGVLYLSVGLYTELLHLHNIMDTSLQVKAMVAKFSQPCLYQMDTPLWTGREVLQVGTSTFISTMDCKVFQTSNTISMMLLTNMIYY